MRVNVLFEKPSKKRDIEAGGIPVSASRLSKSLKKKGIDIDINSDKYDYNIVHIHAVSPYFLKYMKKARKHGAKIIIHAHTTDRDIKDSFTYANRFSLIFLRKYLTFFYNHADIVLTPSNWSKSVLLESGVKRPVFVVSNGINLKEFRFEKTRRIPFRKKYRLKKDDILVYSTGFVFIKKGIETFRKIAENMPNFNFFWIGKQLPLSRIHPLKMSKIIRNLPENLKFLGFINDIRDIHSAGDIFCFPSFHENQGIVILEAAACKRPIVVRDIPVYKDWLFHGKNCLKAKNTEEFVKSIRILSVNKELRNRLVKNAYKTAKENNINKSVRQLIKIYNDISAGNSSSRKN